MPRAILSKLRWLCCCVLATSLACGPAVERRNILFISIDTLRADHLGAYGFDRPTSPNIDAFAQTAQVFEQATSSASWTLPSLTSLMTALYPTTHHCWKIESRLDPSFHTLAEVLRDAGYDTALVPSHLFLGWQYGLQQGFTHIDRELIRSAVEVDRAISSPGVTDKGIAWLQAKAQVDDGVPWFMWLHYFDPHDTYMPHPGISEQFGTEQEIDLYDGEIAFTDSHVGRLLAELQRLGFDRNTIVVLVADHGEEFKEHGNVRHGYTLYQEVIHVPLIIRIPGVAPQRIAPVVSGVDVFPTLLELAHVKYEGAIDGQSLMPLLRGEPEPARTALSEVRWHAGQDMKSVRTEHWKYIEHRLSTQALDLLFDLDLDAAENHDCASAHVDVLERLRETLAHKIERARELGWKYQHVEEAEPQPGSLEQLHKLGYTGDK